MPRDIIATTIDEYLEQLPEDQRAALQKLRTTIRGVVPEAEECISYRLPTFKANGLLVAFGATANHCAFYLLSNTVLAGFGEETKGLDTSKGTIRFQPGRPLPVALVKKLVKARVGENDAKKAARKS